MSARTITLQFGPHELATTLEEWAHCHEKAEIVDLAASKRARQLARECRELEAGRRWRSRSKWEGEWLAMQRAAASVLVGANERAHQPTMELEAPLFDRPTRIGSVDRVMDMDPPTEVSGLVWSEEDDDFYVA
ncbi:MAG: hypothetical protein HOV80_20910 [Polyangiaceae bacterium]|nr:hypothetical protein [Polyangiaceae bacterium]